MYSNKVNILILYLNLVYTHNCNSQFPIVVGIHRNLIVAIDHGGK